MTFYRHITAQLVNWKSRDNRKPLIIRGARQVGKTTLVNDFAQNYEYYINLNLERPSELAFFKKYQDVSTLVEALFVTENILSTKKQNTLLFIDEIQESPEAISSLRYFYEDEPQLHVIAAGSLLEHGMKNVRSFPVGRVEYLYLHPLNFIEFLMAKKHDRALEQLKILPLRPVAHSVLKSMFHEYAILGGMPEIVHKYLQTDSISDLSRVYESIWGTYKDDVGKYARNASEIRIIKHIINTAPIYIDQRIKFQNFGNSNYRSREVGEAMRNLDDSRIIQLIYPTTVVKPPIISDIKKRPRLQFLDTGLVNYELKVQAEMLGIEDLSSAYRGAIIPHVVFQELISLSSFSYRKPNFWVRERSPSSSEVDMVLPYKDKIIPVEIKSGKQGKLKSLHQFIERTDHPYAIRLFAGQFSVERHHTPTKKTPYLLMNLPYYLGSQIYEYIAYFVDHYKL